VALNIAIFASGTGSNALKILEHFKDRTDISVSLIVTNQKNAGVLNHASSFQVPQLILTKALLKNEEFMTTQLKAYEVDFIVLAGFLLLIPEFLVKQFYHKIVNIHPALLPKYGGPGMYGQNVHAAVKAAGELESGITIHYVNAKYDEGGIVFQKTVPLNTHDTPEDIAKKVLTLEHTYFAQVIDNLLTEH
jgi:phosphoribosylglycinamide formyltransferase-1